MYVVHIVFYFNKMLLKLVKEPSYIVTVSFTLISLYIHVCRISDVTENEFSAIQTEPDPVRLLRDKYKIPEFN